MPDKKPEITLETVRLIVNRAIAPLTVEPSQADEDLQELGMDSLGHVAVIVELEKEYGIQIPEEGLLFSQMNTLRKITEMAAGAEQMEEGA